MADQVAIKGAENFLKLSKALKKAGETGLRRDLNAGIRKAAKPLPAKVKLAARRDLPKRGGLNQAVARKPVRVQVRTGAQTVGVRIVASGVDPRINNDGRVAHPVFGRPNSTVVQIVPEAKGYFDETISADRVRIRDDVLDVLKEFTQRVAREAR